MMKPDEKPLISHPTRVESVYKDDEAQWFTVKGLSVLWNVDDLTNIRPGDRVRITITKESENVASN